MQYVAFDVEWSCDRVVELPDGPHGDISTMRPVCASLAWPDGKTLSFADRWHELQPTLDDPGNIIVVHGGHAEAGWCERVGLRFPPERHLDTLLMGVMVAHAVMHEPCGIGPKARGAYGFAKLESILPRYGIVHPWAGDKERIRLSILRGRHLEEFGMDAVIAYNRADAVATLQLVGPLLAEFRAVCGPNAEQNLLRLYQPYALAMAEAARKGFRFDGDAWGKLLELAPRYRGKLLSTMRRYGYDHDGSGIGDRAWARMIREIGLERDWPRTPTTRQFSTKAADIKSMRHLHEALDAAYRLGNFDEFMKQDYGSRVDNDGRLRYGILALAQRSGRSSTTRPNIMGMPGIMRPLLLADEGCRFLHFDFSQKEPGIAAYLSGDESLLADFAGRDDPDDEWSHDVYVGLGRRLGIIRPGMSYDTTKAIRDKVCKSLTLAIMYGMGADSIARRIGCTRHEADVHLYCFARTYPRLAAWSRNFVAWSMGRGFAENIIGFRACFRARTPREEGHVSRSCRNFPVQSSAAAVFQLAGLYLHQLGFDLRLGIHDAYLGMVLDEPASIAQAKQQVEVATTTAVQQLCPGLAVRYDLDEPLLERFAKKGKQDSLRQWAETLEEELCLPNYA